jgi:positive regulator of sigma E activity
LQSEKTNKNDIAMKSLLKYLGPIILLIGTALLTAYYFKNTAENTLLVVAGALMLTGLIAHVVINKYVE